MNHNRRARGRILPGIAAAVLVFANVSGGFRFAQANNENKTGEQRTEEGVITAFPELERSVTFVEGKTAPKSIEEFLGDQVAVTVKETDRKEVESADGRASASQETESADGGASTSRETESAEGGTSVLQEAESADGRTSVLQETESADGGASASQETESADDRASTSQETETVGSAQELKSAGDRPV